ncbi:MAG: CPBP family intramembrane glutamic endopeptidase [Nannocystaceae bacterium]
MGLRAATERLRGEIAALFRHLREHLREDWDPRYYLTVAAFLALTLGLAYAFDVEAEYIDPLHLDPSQIPVYVAFYAIPWVFVVICDARFHGRGAALRDPTLWLAGLAALTLFAVYANFHYYFAWIAAAIPPAGRAFVFHCAANLVRAGLGVAMVVAFWWVCDRRRLPLYGLSRAGFRPGPYLLVLVAIAPMIAWASSQPDFLAIYPRHVPGGEMALWGLSKAQVYAIFELCYGADFLFTELFFRGLLVLAFARWLGPGAVMPMVAFYAFTHVSKPVGETIGSIFGGWALGVLAYRTRSIYGGVTIHLGVAYMMEAAAILQRATLGL